MAKKKYKEKHQDIYAVKFVGNNVADLEEFAPGLIVVKDSQLYLLADGGSQAIQNTDWLMDDPCIGYITVVTDAAFSSRFDKASASA